MDLFPFRAACSFAVDASLAVLCGLLLARRWLSAFSHHPRLPPLTVPAATLCIASFLQLLSLAAVFTGQTSVRAILTALPDILTTHAGQVLGLALAGAVLLLLSTVIPLSAQLRPVTSAVALLACMILRSGAGHAATEDLLTLSQTLQFLHLAAMSVWGGGVIISGLIVLPRLAPVLQPTEEFPAYLAALSRSSTWAVLTVLLSGLLKTYRAIGRDFTVFPPGPWTITLILKILFVVAALFLGTLNRRWLSTTDRWSAAARERSVVALRSEAAIMVAVLLLSGMLANNPPPPRG